MKKLISVISAATIIISCVSCLFFVGAAAAAEDGATLHTEGNQLVTAEGKAIRLIGLNIPYTSWSDDCEKQVTEGLEICFDDWGSNAVRYPVTPELWFGPNKERYRAIADKVIKAAADKGKYVILDNHSFYLPDDNDIKLWKDLAVRYKNHPYVVFEMFNEPAGCTWQQYFEGGRLTYKGKNDWGEDADITVDSCGIPALFKAVRETGAKNVCIMPGINWSFDLSMCTEENFREFAKSIAEDKGVDAESFAEDYYNKYFIKETDGNGIMYSTHPYPTKPTDWDQYLSDTVLEYPVLVGECGPTEKENGFIRALSDNDKSYLDTLTDYIDKYELSVTPWAWGAWPYLNQEPSNKLSAFGTYMKKYFEKSAAEKAVTLFPETDYSGKSVTMDSGSYTSADLKVLGLDVTEIKSASAKEDYYQYTVTLYEKDNYEGKTYTFVPSAPNIGQDIIGFKAQSLKIERSVPVNILPGHSSVIADGCTENQKPENIIDGRNGTVWKYTSEKPAEIVICLDSVYAITRLDIAHASEASMMSVYNASDYTVSVSTDGQTFTRIIDVTDNSLGLCSYNFEQVFASYIKIRLTKGSIIDNTNYILAEVMAYGTEYTGSKDGMNVTINKYANNTEPDKENLKTPITVLSVCGGVLIVFAAASAAFAVIGKKRKK